MFRKIYRLEVNAPCLDTRGTFADYADNEKSYKRNPYLV